MGIMSIFIISKKHYLIMFTLKTDQPIRLVQCIWHQIYEDSAIAEKSVFPPDKADKNKK